MKISYVLLFLVVVFLVAGVILVHRSLEVGVNVYDYYSGEQRENVESSQIILLWNEDNIPTETIYTENTGNYFDDLGFVPYMTRYEAEGDAKGAVLINPGGDVQFRSETTEGQEVTQKLSSLGYVTFVVHYRVRPYTMQEGALDLARAVRYVRSHADDYQIDKEDIAIIGFSAGGILCGKEVLHYDGFVNGTSLDASYVSDELDEVSVDVHVLENMPHGFGIGREDSQWIIPFDEWLSKIFEN